MSPGASLDKGLARRLKPPAQNVALAARHLLLRSLDIARAGRLIVLVAPAGYGKTTALAQWWDRQRTEGLVAAWYSALDDDGSPVAFLHAVARSLSTAGVDLGTKFLSALEDAAPERMLAALLEAMETTAAPIVLIIDEFERIDRPQIIRLVEALVSDAPDQVTIAVTARRRPSFALSRLHAQGLVRMIDTTELQLSREEVGTLLQPGVATAELDHVMTTTEGWPIAVQLYRLWRARGPARDMPSFAGRLSDMADYFTQHLFGTVSPACRDLIIDLSLFEFVEAVLLDAARDRADSALLLDDLHRQLPGLVQQAGADGLFAYRLHPLIADYGRSRLALDPVRSRQLDLRAGEWLWSSGRFPAAIRHRLRGETPDALAVKLATLEFLPIFLAEGATALRAILCEIPKPVVVASPRLQLMAALAHFKTGLFSEAAEMLRSVESATDGFSVDPFGHHLDLRIEGLALKLMFSVYIEGPSASSAPQIATLLDLAGDRPLICAWCENVMIALYQERGALDDARDAAARTSRIYQASGFLPFSELYIRTHDMLIAYAQGSLRKVGEMAGATGRQKREGNADPPLSAMARLTSAVVEYERTYRDTCVDVVHVALSQFGEGEAWFDQYALAYPVLADVGWRRSGLLGVLAVLTEVDDRLARRGMNALRSYSNSIESHYRIRDGELGSTAPAGSPRSWRERDLRSHNEVLGLLGRAQFDDAERLAGLWYDDVTRAGRGLAKVRAQIMRAVAIETSGRTADAEDALRGAIRLAFPERITAAFAQEGQMLEPLLERVVNAGGPAQEKRFAAALLARVRAPALVPPNDLLSVKESCILAHVAAGASNKLIARQLGVSDNAIKFHLKKVYTKLGVSSRKAAVAAASVQGTVSYPN